MHPSFKEVYMLDLQAINDTIDDLEHEPLTLDLCEKLATLYICQEHEKNRLNRKPEGSESTLHELQDILPSYYKYVDTKRRYQKYEVVEQMVIIAMQNLCDEIVEFVSELYHNTETDVERAIIVKMINDDLRSAV
jgi:hypothetical protein